MSDRESQHEVRTMRGVDSPPGITSAEPRTIVAPPSHSGLNPNNHPTSIFELYHLTRIENYGTWAFRMNNVLLKDELFEFSTVAPNDNLSETERKSRPTALSAINNSIKGDVALKLLKRYF